MMISFRFEAMLPKPKLNDISPTKQVDEMGLSSDNWKWIRGLLKDNLKHHLK